MSESQQEVGTALRLDRRYKALPDREVFHTGTTPNSGPKGNGHRTDRRFRRPVARSCRSLFDLGGVSLAVGSPRFRRRRHQGRASAKSKALASGEAALGPFSDFDECFSLPGLGAW